MKRKITQISVIGLIFAVLITYLLLRNPIKDFEPGRPGPDIEFVVTDGETGSTIAMQLAKFGVIEVSRTFYKLAITDPRSKSISPGLHRIGTHLSSKEALNQLLDSSRLVDQVIVKEGSTYSDVLKLLVKDRTIDNSSKKELVKIPPPLFNPRNSVEGMLFPAQYSFPPHTTAVQALHSMLTKFESVARSVGLYKGYGSYSAYQILIIASLAQVEGDNQDFAKIARVILNRLSIGMPLQLNSTVQYAANLRGQIQLSHASTQINSPYNTYRILGLTPTPISNPGEGALRAALHPEVGNWIYFITVKPSDTRFTNHYSQFAQWEVLYHQNLAAGAFK
jgi:UPF0755 protein